MACEGVNHKLDQLMPFLQTLEIEELVTETELDRMRAKAKRITGRPASLARLLADRLRAEMHDPVPAAQASTADDEADGAAPAESEAGIKSAGLALPSSLDVGTGLQAINVDQHGASPPDLLRHAVEGPTGELGVNGTARPD